ncbi:MAG: hypothetical protein KDK50_01090 [Chlamydiia bacterium]|nr:hypothetical protein [Chlamydiia bacterium]
MTQASQPTQHSSLWNHVNTVRDFALTGCLRIPALVAQASAASMVGVVVFRGLKMVGSAFISPEAIAQFYARVVPSAVQATLNVAGERSLLFTALDTFSMLDKYSTQQLLITASATLVWSALVLEGCHYLCGKPSPLYNQVLSVTRLEVKDTSLIEDAKTYIG